MVAFRRDDHPAGLLNRCRKRLFDQKVASRLERVFGLKMIGTRNVGDRRTSVSQQRFVAG